MASRPVIRAPTNASIPDTYKVPSTTRSLVKILGRLSRDSLIDLALEWLQEENYRSCTPYLASNRDVDEEAEEDYLYTPADTIEQLRTVYEALRNAPEKKRDVIARILDGDWRRGITLQQLAMIDFRHLHDHEASLRWTALKLVALDTDSSNTINPLKKGQRIVLKVPSFPRIHPSTFLRALQHQVSPLVKGHYYLHRLLAPYNLSILRIYIADTPYTTPGAASQSYFGDAARTLFIAFPDSCPFLYVALSGHGSGASKVGASQPKIDIVSLKRIILEAVPKALSRPQERYALETTSMSARNLSTMCNLRGNNRSGASQGAYSIFVDASVDESPANSEVGKFQGKVLPRDEEDQEQREAQEIIPAKTAIRKRKALTDANPNNLPSVAGETKRLKKRRSEVAKRFGTTGLTNSSHDIPIDRLYVKLEERFHPTKALNLRSPLNLELDQLQPTNTKRGPKSQKASILSSFHPQSNSSREEADQESSMDSTAPLSLTFHGSDVFAGIRKLAEIGLIDLEKMPAWMTGEEGVSGMTVRNRRVIDGKAGGA